MGTATVRPVRLALGALVMSLALAGCLPSQPSPRPSGDSPPSQPTTTQPSVTPTPSAPTTPTATPTPPGYFPSAEGALDVSAYDEAHFASPSGRIWCALMPDFAACNFPSDVDQTQIPSSQEICPEDAADLDVTGIGVGEEGASAYICSGDPVAIPYLEESFVEWWQETGFPSVDYEGFEVATLPNGEKLVLGDFVCESAETGMSCGNTATGQGFTVARSGVTLLER